MDAKDEEVSALAAQLNKANMIDNNYILTKDDDSNIDIHDSLNNSQHNQIVDHTCSNHKAIDANFNKDKSTTTTEEGVEFCLPPEIMIAIFGHLSIPSLLVCQRVSRNFRVISRTVMLDKLGGRAMFNNNGNCQHCSQCRRHQHSTGTTPAGGGSGSNGLPPLPYHYLINNPNTQLPTAVSPVNHHISYLPSPQQQQDPPHHQLHHHLYQHQSTEDMSQHHQTDLHIHHQSHSYHVQSRPSQSSQQPYSDSHHASQYHHTASYIAPGNIALFLFPYHDHSPTSWQDRQTVHFVCTGIDRHKEQLVFSPIFPEIGDCLKFNTNSWDLPSSFTAPSFGDGLGSFNAPSVVLSRGQDSRARSNNNNNNSNIHIGTGNNNNINNINNGFPTASVATTRSESSYTSPATGLDLFDYSTGRPRFPGSRQANTDSLNSTSYTFANQFNRTHSRSPSLASPSSSASSSFSSTPSSTSSSPPRLSPQSITSTSPPSPSWANVNGHGGEHYSVIGIKHGDWPEDRQAAGRWWGGGLQSSMSQESTVYMPWAGASSAFDFQQGASSFGSAGRTYYNTSTQQGANMENTSPTTATTASSGKGAVTVVGGGGDGCTKVHRHHMYLSSTRRHNPPAHHHRYLCLHHDQLMTDIAAFNAATDSKSKNRASKMPMTTAGSRHLEVDYGARVTESKRCLFCLSTPCKANLEIQVKFDQLRVSLDWILSGFGPDQRKSMAHSTSHGGSAIADALAMGSARQGQVPS
ncbi:MAG: hypothetical protein J3R72DRAFT_500713 [Linnemannia gamsii]|nr:MAG: hypothetical protein J3R72DRAFT_500713 [Linnemannia gamsii]